ncbi:hypothetical protein [Streptomyces sp. NPDC005281]
MASAGETAYITEPAHNVIAWWTTGRPDTPVAVPAEATSQQGAPA